MTYILKPLPTPSPLLYLHTPHLQSHSQHLPFSISTDSAAWNSLLLSTSAASVLILKSLDLGACHFFTFLFLKLLFYLRTTFRINNISFHPFKYLRTEHTSFSKKQYIPLVPNCQRMTRQCSNPSMNSLSNLKKKVTFLSLLKSGRTCPEAVEGCLHIFSTSNTPCIKIQTSSSQVTF